MRVFLDTNVILEGMMCRAFAAESECVLNAIATKQIEGYMSVGSFYTVTFYAEKRLKLLYENKQERMTHLRASLKKLLRCVTIVGQDNQDLLNSVDNALFEDIEDSFQYQASEISCCDYFVTINVKDFPSKSSVPVIHLSDFVKILGK